MAERTVNDPIHANLVCPLCLTIFESATLLTCGHTFCQKCLMGYDMGQREKDHMICPLCREKTSLGEKRVQGLPRNVTVNALVNDLQAHVPSENRMAQSEGTASAQPRQVKPKPPVTVPIRPPTIIKEIDLPGGVRGMTRLSDDTVAVGYGSSFPGAEAVSVSGDRKPYLRSGIGSVRDIVVLNDKRAVVSQGFEDLKVYNKDGTVWEIPFQRMAKKTCQDAFCTLYRDNQDYVYTVNGTNKIQYFHVRDKGMTHHSRVITTKKTNVAQICVTQTGVLVMRVSNAKPRKIVFVDKEGNMGSAVTARNENEILCATVDALDRVVIGYFSPHLGTLTLSVCTLKGLQIKHQRFLSEIYLSTARQVWCYMVSITPNLLAFAHLDRKLFFIKVPPIPEQ